MSATACTLAAVLVFEAAAASPATEECPLTDNRCKAGQYERRAATAPTPAQRALYLYGAYRSYMLLFENTADRADLCAARRTLDASLTVAGQPPDQIGYAGLLGLGVEGVDQLRPARCKFQRLAGQLAR